MTKRFEKGTKRKPQSAWRDMWVDWVVASLGSKDWLTAVDHVSLQIRKGEFFGLLGPNGAGKTTLVKMLCTLLLPDEGTAIVNGSDIVNQPHEVKASISVVGQHWWLGFDWQFNVHENLEFWAGLFGYTKTEAKARAKKALGIVGLLDRANDKVENLSGGMRQRLVIAQGLTIEAPVFLLDEPTVHLDPISANDIRTFVKAKLNRKLKQTVLWCTHFMQEADLLCDRVAIIDKGQIVVCDSPGNLKETIKDEDVLEFEVQNLDSNLITRIRKLRHVRRAILDYNSSSLISTLRIRVTDQSSASPEIIRLIEKDGGKIVSVKSVEPTLEDVFMYYTGGNSYD